MCASVSSLMWTTFARIIFMCVFLWVLGSSSVCAPLRKSASQIYLHPAAEQWMFVLAGNVASGTNIIIIIIYMVYVPCLRFRISDDERRFKFTIAVRDIYIYTLDSKSVSCSLGPASRGKFVYAERARRKPNYIELRMRAMPSPAKWYWK